MGVSIWTTNNERGGLPMTTSKSIAIIGEGETEWFYFESLRITCRYPFKVAPDFPQHSDIPHMAKLAEDYVKREYDYVVCLVDMDRLMQLPKEMQTYQRIRKQSSKKIMWIETNPCTEFWFLLHFLPQLSLKHYDSYEALLPELQHYMPGYEKTARYFRKNNLYRYLTENGNIQRAMGYGAELSRLSEATPEDRIAYSQVHRVFELIASINETNQDKNNEKSENEIRISVKQQEILDFLASNADSYSKSISKAIGLRVPRTRDYLKQLLEMGLIEEEGEVRYKVYRLKNK